jgi:glutathione synthase/RimK-type ligase-like ATP-grasp enzyme
MPGLDSLRVGVVTGPRNPDLTAGARELVAEFERRGATAAPAVWTDDDEENWPDFDVLLLRSCWDYHERIDDFRDWLETVEEAGVTVLNPPDAVRWNVHKFYLRDLADAGVPVLETAFVERGSDRRLEGVLADRGWAEAVVKPAVATSSAGAWRASRADPDEQRFEDAVAAADTLVQRFAPEIRDGERSLAFFGGEFAHAARRLPASDDFRAHHRFGGDSTRYDPAEETVEQAAGALAAARDHLGVSATGLPYARVDGVLRDGRFVLMELELVEPYLWLGEADGAVEGLADAVEAAP